MGPINVCEIIVIVNNCDRMRDVSGKLELASHTSPMPFASKNV